MVSSTFQVLNHLRRHQSELGVIWTLHTQECEITHIICSTLSTFDSPNHVSVVKSVGVMGSLLPDAEFISSPIFAYFGKELKNLWYMKPNVPQLMMFVLRVGDRQFF